LATQFATCTITHAVTVAAGVAPGHLGELTRCLPFELVDDVLGSAGSGIGWAGPGYPTLRLMTLVETGTRALIGAVIGSAGDRDEAGLARRLLPLLRPGMLVLLDRITSSHRRDRERVLLVVLLSAPAFWPAGRGCFHLGRLWRGSESGLNGRRSGSVTMPKG
jgi:hypothetical protein